MQYNNAYLLRIWVRIDRYKSNHFLVRKFIFFCNLYDSIKHKNAAISLPILNNQKNLLNVTHMLNVTKILLRLQNGNVLKLGLFLVEDLVYFE